MKVLEMKYLISIILIFSISGCVKSKSDRYVFNGGGDLFCQNKEMNRNIYTTINKNEGWELKTKYYKRGNNRFKFRECRQFKK